MYRGIGVCDGVVIAKAFVLKKETTIYQTRSGLTDQKEIERFNHAVETFIENTLEFVAKIDQSAGNEHAQILEAQTVIVKDPGIRESIIEAINEGWTAETAVSSAFSMFADMFIAMKNDMMKERAHDLEDIKIRLLEILTGNVCRDIDSITEECVIVARDMTPSETSRINKEFVRGVVTETGGINSHMAIMAKAMNLVTVLSIENITSHVKTGDTIAINGGTGEVVINPSSSELVEFNKQLDEFSVYKKELEAYKSRESITLDGIRVEIAANVGSPEDLDAVINSTADGIGLFRTEFLFMEGDSPPDEEQQFKVYKQVAEAMGDKSVIIRSLDIGGDKELPYLNLQKEENPFLGYRAIRLCLGDKELFNTQLRALLRAGNYGNIKIMIPMICTITELRQAKAIIADIKSGLLSDGVPINNDIEIGVMIETPAAALIADLLAREADFFSIGTNDLIQYTMAVDRGNEKVQYLYSAYEPAVIRSIYNIIKAGKDAGIFVGMCGESAGDVNMIPFLLACGLDEFSMSAQSVLRARKIVCNLSKSELQSDLEKILNMSTREEIFDYLKTIYSSIAI